MVFILFVCYYFGYACFFFRVVRISWKYFYAIISFGGQIFMTVMTLYKLFLEASLKAAGKSSTLQ